MSELEKKLEEKFSVIPKSSMIIYVPSSLYLSHGIDDFTGGQACISKVEIGKSGGKHTYYIRIHERHGHLYNWEFLINRQEELKERYGDQKAHPDPDYSPEFNESW